MIVVSKLSKEKFAVNPDLIQRIDSSPDTILTLVDGTKYIVRESMAQVIDLIDAHRVMIISRSQNFDQPQDPGTSGRLSLIHTED
ncbi:flagellar FlbD family protein [Jonesiaceae bacterium BS-20]|uniref:Flagellar FlbD family protein n=1 Tax=Jonesiaceae bacterium BS-20 TaxID=3120821 RepID=A0AAU7DYM2_9MICO